MKQAILNLRSLTKKYDLIKLSSSKKSLILLLLLLIFGMILGSVSVSSLSNEYINKLDFLFLNDFKERISQSSIQIFTSSFSSLSIFAIILELSALSCWGVLLIPLIIGFKGFGLGITAGYLYLSYGLKGIAFYILILLPGIFISSIALALFGEGCMKFSFKLSKTLLSKEPDERILENLKRHLRKSGYCLILLAMSSIIDICFVIMFSRFFHF